MRTSLSLLLIAMLTGCASVPDIRPAEQTTMRIADTSRWDVVAPTRTGLEISDNAGSPLQREAASQAVWYEGSDLHVEGRGWDDTKNFWNRLPARAEGVVPGDVWSLSQNTAGMAVRFATNAPTIHARWSGGGAMNHMAASGVSGLDLYKRQADGTWTFAAVGRPQLKETIVTLGGDLTTDGAFQEYLLFLPLYQNVSLFEIGVPEGAEIRIPSAAEIAAAPKPIVFYGTSITQGGCASRTGMAHPAILRRRLDREIINLGFSGSGRMEPEMARLIRELDPEFFVFDNLPNLNDELAKERIEPFVRLIRETHPTAPILLVEDFRPIPRNEILRTAFDNLVAEGVVNLHYMPAATGMIVNGENGTVDGVHPTDLGYLHMADVFEPHLRKLLGE